MPTALTLIVMTGAAIAAPAPIATEPGSVSPSYTLEPARITDGARMVLPPMAIARTKPEPDQRPLYLGAGLIGLAAVFWWNRRRREQLERDDATSRGEAATDEASPGDEDGDELHRAARGDAPKDEA